MGDEVSPETLLTALLRLREALSESDLPLDDADMSVARAEREALLGQLDDHILPRLVRLDAPLLAVVGGSTGAGKSTLVNSLLGRAVSPAGVLRPTTRGAVLAHHIDDAAWFGADRLLPDLERVTDAGATLGQLRLTAVDGLPAGLALLDAPDIDSVEAANRRLATQLLRAADLWIFVTTAARYADQVPWEFLRSAAERGASVAIVLDRTAPASLREVGSHLSRMLASRGLGDAPLFSVPETTTQEGLLPDETVHELRAWLAELAADASARNAVIARTLHGAIGSLPRRSDVVSRARAEQEQVWARLHGAAVAAYADALDAVDAGCADGTLLRGEVLSRWQEFVGTSDLLSGLQERVGRARDRVTKAARGQAAPTQPVESAVGASLHTLIVEHAEAAAERAAAEWARVPAGAALLAGAPAGVGRASAELPAAAERLVRDWQGEVLRLVRTEGATRRSTARALALGVNGLGIALMVVIFASTAGLTGAEIGVAGGTAVVGQKVLEAVFGDQAVRRLAARARHDLRDRVGELFAGDRARLLSILDANPVPGGSAEALRLRARELAVLGPLAVAG